jgi:hypothetical protein
MVPWTSPQTLSSSENPLEANGRLSRLMSASYPGRYAEASLKL